MDDTITILEQPDKDSSTDISQRDNYRTRTAVRAVLLDKPGRVALMHSLRYGYYKLPGGGVDADEQLSTALQRELKEETGCTAEVTKELGKVIEWRDSSRFMQVSYAYHVTLLGEPGEPSLTDREIDEGFVLEWAENLNQAIEKVEAGLHYPAINIVSISQRDVAILKSLE
jgi:8-oxo-dGTP diphosphatase